MNAHPPRIDTSGPSFSKSDRRQGVSDQAGLSVWVFFGGLEGIDGASKAGAGGPLNQTRWGGWQAVG